MGYAFLLLMQNIKFSFRRQAMTVLNNNEMSGFVINLSLTYMPADFFNEINVRLFLQRHSIWLPGILLTNPVECIEPHTACCVKDSLVTHDMFFSQGHVYVCSRHTLVSFDLYSNFESITLQFYRNLQFGPNKRY